MKRLFSLALAVVLVCALCGCKEEVSLSPRTIDGLTITLPENFVDLSDDEMFSDFSFVFSFYPVAVSGLKEDKALLRQYSPDLTLEDYANLLIKAHGISAQLQQTDGIYRFTYEAGTDTRLTYVVSLWETGDAFWTVQAYCPAEDYPAVKDDIWQYLSSVTF